MIDDRGAVRQVNVLRPEAADAERVECLLEPVDLQPRERIARIVGHGQMRKDAGQGDPGSRGKQDLREGRDVGGGHTEAAHARVDLEVGAGPDAAPLRRGRERLHLVGAEEGRDQIVGQDEVGLGGGEPAEDDDLSSETGPAELDALLRQRHAEPAHAIRLERPRHLHGAVAVGVRLHDREDRHAPDARPDGPHVREEQLQVDLGPGGPEEVEMRTAHSCRHSISSNFVYSRMKARSIVPIGPFRCLAMMTWARPRFSSVGL